MNSGDNSWGLCRPLSDDPQVVAGWRSIYHFKTSDPQVGSFDHFADRIGSKVIDVVWKTKTGPPIPLKSAIPAVQIWHFYYQETLWTENPAGFAKHLQWFDLVFQIGLHHYRIKQGFLHLLKAAERVGLVNSSAVFAHIFARNLGGFVVDLNAVGSVAIIEFLEQMPFATANIKYITLFHHFVDEVAAFVMW